MRNSCRQRARGRVGNAIVVAYRGTLAPGGSNVAEIVDDWLNNAQTRMIPRPGFGDVHEGFYQSHQALWPHVRDAIQKRLDGGPANCIIVTGHSKGGALAVLGAAAIRQWKNIPVHVVTFAGPRAGGKTFADRYRTLNIPTLRYENRADLVPYVPLGNVSQGFVWSLLKMLGAKYPVTGFISVGEALVDGPNALEVTGQWVAIGYRFWRTRSLQSAVPLVAAHRIDDPHGRYPQMVAAQAARCTHDRHPECMQALG